MNEHSLIYMTNLYEEAMDLNTKLQEELENLKNTNEEHRVLNGKLREENKRLNNIINELEKWLYDRSEFTNFGVIIDKLQELKGSNGAIPPEVIGTNGEDGGLFDYGDR